MSAIPDKINRLLFAWGVEYSNNSNRRAINQLTGQINASPGAQLMKDTKNQTTALGINDKGSYMSEFTSECLVYVNSLIMELPPKLRKVIEARYKGDERVTTKAKCKRLRIDKSTFYRRLIAAHERLDNIMDWGLVK